MKLDTERLLLCEFEQDDIPTLYRLNRHPEVQRFEEGPPVTESQFTRIIQNILAEQTDNPRQSYYFVIVRRVDSSVIGSCYIAIRDEAHRQAEIGYILGFDYWSQGYATEAAHAVVAFGFETLDMHRIYAEALCENQASLRVLEKLNMQREGLLHEHRYFQDRWWDTCIYALLEDQWRKVHS